MGIYQCASLNDITLSKNLDRLHRYVFNDTGWWNSHADGLLYLGNVLVGFKNTTPEIVEVEDGTRLIADRALYHCPTIRKLIVSDSVKSMLRFSG